MNNYDIILIFVEFSFTANVISVLATIEILNCLAQHQLYCIEWIMNEVFVEIPNKGQ